MTQTERCERLRYKFEIQIAITKKAERPVISLLNTQIHNESDVIVGWLRAAQVFSRLQEMRDHMNGNIEMRQTRNRFGQHRELQLAPLPVLWFGRFFDRRKSKTRSRCVSFNRLENNFDNSAVSVR